MFVICVEVIKYFLLHDLLDCTFKKNMDRVSKVLKSSKHHNIWFQMKEHLNIPYLFIQYFNYQVLQNQKGQPFIQFFFFCAECDTEIIQNIWKYKISLENACERFFVSANRKRRDIKIPLCLSAPVWKSLI